MKQVNTLLHELYMIACTLDAKTLTQLLDIAKGFASGNTDSTVVKGKKGDKPEPEYKKLHVTKGIPSKVWSAINHDFTANGGKWVKGKKKGTGYWEFDTVAQCTEALTRQQEYCKAHDVECALATLA